VKTTKKDKPYLICDPCGVQLFVRGKGGIQRFETQNAGLEKDNIWKRLAELERHYLLQCPKCGKKFWLEPKRIRKGFANAKLLAYRCHDPECTGNIDLEGLNSKESTSQEKTA
jgi:hypothetical protein